MKKILFFIGIILSVSLYSCDFFSIDEDVRSLSDKLSSLEFDIHLNNDSIETLNLHKTHLNRYINNYDSIKRVVDNYQRKVNKGMKIFPLYDCYVIDKQDGTIYEDWEFVDVYIEDWDEY